MLCTNNVPLNHWAVLSHVFLFSDYQTQNWSSGMAGRSKCCTSTHFLLPDTSVPMEPNPVTMQMVATYPSEMSELTYFEHTPNCEASFPANHVQ
jgi:hypothetical protein